MPSEALESGKKRPLDSDGGLSLDSDRLISSPTSSSNNITSLFVEDTDGAQQDNISNIPPPPVPRCRFFAAGFCASGESCRFAHVSDKSLSSMSSLECVHHKRGSCREGEKCRFLHAQPIIAQKTSAHDTTQASAIPSICKYVNIV